MTVPTPALIRNILPHFPFMKMLSAILVLGAGSIHADDELHYFSRPEMGSVLHVKLYAESREKAFAAASEAFTRVEQINRVASDYEPESELSRLNKAPENTAIPVSQDLFKLIEKSLEVARLTDGAFDITCAYAVQNWRRSTRQNKLPEPAQTKHAIEMTDWRALKLDPDKRTVTKLKKGLLLDLGGIGKGYAAHEALLVLKKLGYGRALVAASGDVAIGDPPPDKPGWDIALRTYEHPADSDELVHAILHNCGVSTSGDLHQFVEIDGNKYSHIIDPKTGLGMTERIACTVIAPTAFDSDAFDTPMCVLGVARGLELIKKLPGHHARFVTIDKTGMHETLSPQFFPAEKP